MDDFDAGEVASNRIFQDPDFADYTSELAERSRLDEKVCGLYQLR